MPLILISTPLDQKCLEVTLSEMSISSNGLACKIIRQNIDFLFRFTSLKFHSKLCLNLEKITTNFLKARRCKFIKIFEFTSHTYTLYIWVFVFPFKQQKQSPEFFGSILIQNMNYPEFLWDFAHSTEEIARTAPEVGQDRFLPNNL